MTYIDGFVAPVRTADRDAYLDHARHAAVIFKEHGALSIVENWGSDVPDGELTSLPMAVRKKDDEVVVFSWVVWPSKAVRDEGWAAIMKDPRMSAQENPMPFDGKRMIFGGFETILET